MSTLLELKNVSKIYGSLHALDHGIQKYDDAADEGPAQNRVAVLDPFPLVIGKERAHSILLFTFAFLRG